MSKGTKKVVWKKDFGKSWRRGRALTKAFLCRDAGGQFIGGVIRFKRGIAEEIGTFESSPTPEKVVYRLWATDLPEWDGNPSGREILIQMGDYCREMTAQAVRKN
jgi:hypothetical protein